MKLRPGQKLHSAVCDAQVVVVKAPADAVDARLRRRTAARRRAGSRRGRDARPVARRRAPARQALRGRRPRPRAAVHPGRHRRADRRRPPAPPQGRQAAALVRLSGCDNAGMNLLLLLDMAAAGRGDEVVVQAGDDRLTAAELLAAAWAGADVAAGAVGPGLRGHQRPRLPDRAVRGRGRAACRSSPLNYRLSDDQLHDLLAPLGDTLVVAEGEVGRGARGPGPPRARRRRLRGDGPGRRRGGRGARRRRGAGGAALHQRHDGGAQGGGAAAPAPDVVRDRHGRVRAAPGPTRPCW